jgi:hypothetical protein
MIFRHCRKCRKKKLGRHYEFECGFGIPLLKKYRAQFAAQSPQTPETPKRHKRCRHQILKLCFDARNDFLGRAELRSLIAFSIIILSGPISTPLSRQRSRQSQAESIKSSMQSGAVGGAASSDMWLRWSIRRCLLSNSDIEPMSPEPRKRMPEFRGRHIKVDGGRSKCNFNSNDLIINSASPLYLQSGGLNSQFALQVVTTPKGGSGPNRFASDKSTISRRPLVRVSVSRLESQSRIEDASCKCGEIELSNHFHLYTESTKKGTHDSILNYEL